MCVPMAMVLYDFLRTRTMWNQCELHSSAQYRDCIILRICSWTRGDLGILIGGPLDILYCVGCFLEAPTCSEGKCTVDLHHLCWQCLWERKGRGGLMPLHTSTCWEGWSLSARSRSRWESPFRARIEFAVSRRGFSRLSDTDGMSIFAVPCSRALLLISSISFGQLL